VAVDDVSPDLAGEDRRRVLRSVIDANRFMILATADDRGTPWATPVWFANPDGRRFLWVSSPTTRHSRNIASRPDVAIVIYDSRTAVADRQAVYAEATAHEVAEDELEEGIEIFSRESVSQGLAEWEDASCSSTAPSTRSQAVQVEAREQRGSSAVVLALPAPDRASPDARYRPGRRARHGSAPAHTGFTRRGAVRLTNPQHGPCHDR